MTTDSNTTWYAATCPPWCEGKHPPFLALGDDTTITSEIVTHTRTVAGSDAAGLLLELAADDAHPASGWATADLTPRVLAWLGNADEPVQATPAQLRPWAALLDQAANRATQLLGEAAE